MKDFGLEAFNMDSLIILITLMLLLIVFSKFVGFYMRRRYFVKLFKPIKLKRRLIKEFEAKSRIAIKWEPDDFIYSLAAALKMAHNYYYEEKIDVHEINFYLGWTYTWIKSGTIDRGLIFPLRDPLEFLPRVGVNIGLSISMYTCGDYNTFIRGIKSFISKGKPILVVADSRLFRESESESVIMFRQYFILVVGYDDKGKILYLDTIFEGDGERESVEREVDSTILVEAMVNYFKLIKFPFKYAFWVLDKGVKRSNLQENLNFIGKHLIGGSYKSNFHLGSRALDALAKEVEEKGVPNKTVFSSIFKFANKIREDDAKFLNNYLSKVGSEKILRLAQNLEKASFLYLKISYEEEVENIVRMLKEAAKLEREAGEYIIQ